MCVVSMVMDHYNDKWRDYTFTGTWPPIVSPTKQEFDALKKEVEDLKALLARAKKYDADNNEPDCEMEEKIALIRKVAELVGVELSI